MDNTIRRLKLYPVDNAIGFLNTYPLDSDYSDGQCYPMCDQPGPGEWKRLLVSAIYSHLFCDRGFTLLHSTKMSYVVAHCIYDLYVIRIKRETRWQSTYLTIWIHLKPNQCTLRRSQSTVFRNLLFTSVLNHRTKRSSSKKLVMERCSDQTMKGEKRIYYKKLKVYDVWETSAKIPCWWRVTTQNFCARFSDVISQRKQWWRGEMLAVFLG